jgi:nitroreductase
VLKKLKNIVKNLLAIAVIRNIFNKVQLIVLSVFASNRLLAGMYSIIGIITFNREQYAVIRGRRNYYQNLKKTRQSHVELRRNIHRLEKGLIMQPRRDIFARDYIGETIEFYEEATLQCAIDPESIDSTEMEWAHDVMSRYFSIVKTGNDVIDNARRSFEATDKNDSYATGVEKAPFQSKTRIKSDVTYDGLMDLAMQRRSVRWFEQKKVPRELIDKAMMVGRQAPTACNRLPYEFRIFDDPEMVKIVAGLPFGAEGYAHQIPTVVVVVGKLESYFSPRDRHAIYVDSSLSAMSFIFALETLGLSSSVINWPDFEPLEAKMQKTLGLDVSERVVMLIAVGYADPNGGIPYSQKKSLDVLRTYNKLST